MKIHAFYSYKVDRYYKPDEEEKAKIFIGSIREFIYTSIHFSSNSLLFFSVPVKLYGGGNIKLNAIKQVKVTDDYLKFDSQTRGCQNEKTYEDCVTDLYLGLLRENCKCLPFHLQNFGKQNELKKVRLFQEKICISKEEKECVRSTVIPFKSCLPPCEGLHLDFERSSATLRKDVRDRNKFFMDNYLNYIRFHNHKAYSEGITKCFP